MPDVYEARAQVFVDTSDPLEQARAATDADVKVAFVRRMLLSTPNLEQVARETDLDLRADTPQEFQALVLKLQREISVQPGSGRGFDANLYSIVYQDVDRRIAERVVQVLLNSFQEQSLEGRPARRPAGAGVPRQPDGGVSPPARGSRGPRRRVPPRQRRHDRRRGRVLHASTPSGRAPAGARQPEGRAGAPRRAGGPGLRIRRRRYRRRGGRHQPGELQTQVLQAEQRLDELRLLYTDEHPSVVSARETLAALQGRLERRRDELGPLLGVSGGGGAVVENVRIALNTVEIDITELRGRERNLEQRINELQDRVDIAPQLEAELAGLNRDHTVLRNQYENLLQRRELLSFDIDRKRTGRQLEFRIIEPPRAPELPVAPDRFRLMVMVLFAALGAGGGLAFVLHQMKPVFVTGEMVYQQLGIPVLGSVTMAWTKRAMWARRRTEMVFALGLILLFGYFGVVFLALPQMAALAQQLLA
jgi:hypothetical protein